MPDEINGSAALVKDLAYTMYKAEGVGLAATQVGINKRIVVIDISRKSDKDKIYHLDEFGENSILNSNNSLIVAINPEIVFKDGKTVHEEGCLSVPDFHADIARADTVRVKALNLSGNEIIMEASGLLSIAFQHEIDHLDGVLFIDKASPLKRSLYNTALRKLKAKKQEKALDYTS